MISSTLPRVLMIWPYGINGAESIPMCLAFLVPRLEGVADVFILDCSLMGVHPASDKFITYIDEAKPDIVGISAWSQNWRWVERTILTIRDRFPNAKIVLGGPHVTATNDWGKADFALTGEAERTFPELVAALARNASQAELEQIAGLRCFGQTVKMPQPLIQDLDGLGLPDFEAMLLKLYQEHGYKYRNGVAKQAPILATRGCPYICSFCIEGDQRVLMADWSWKAIKNIKIGDKVMSLHEGSKGLGKKSRIAPTEVNAVTHVGQKETINIRVGDKILICTPDHKLYVDDGHKTRWKRADTTRVGRTKFKTFYPEDNTSEDFKKGWLAGYLAGDGCIHYRCGKKQITITSRDVEMLDIIEKWLAEFGCTVRRFKHKMGSGIFPTKLDPIYIDGVQCTSGPESEKILSILADIDSRDYKRGWLAGMYDSDGSLGDNSCRITQSQKVKPHNCDKIEKAISELGLFCSIQRRDGMNTYVTNIANFLTTCRPMMGRKYPNWYGYKSLIKNEVDEVCKGGLVDVYDITTDSHSFICEGFVVHNCEAPILSGRKIRKHSIPYLKELLGHLRKDYDVTHINIVDDNFSFYPSYAIEFCEMVLATPEFKGMTFATPNGLRVERSNLEMFKAMKAAGWSSVIFAPESGSQRMVDIMAKHLDLNVIPDRVALAHQAGLGVEAFFILNYPGETDEDIAATAKFIKVNDFDEISLHIFKPLPHTPIWRELVEDKKIAPDYVVGRYDEVDWLANGRTRWDIDTMVTLYNLAAKSVKRVA